MSRYHLGILQVWIHTRIFIKEPYADKFRCLLGIFLVAAKVPGKGKSSYTLSCFSEAVAIQLVQFGVRLAVMADVRQAIGFGGIGPIIACLTHVVVLVSATRCLLFQHDGQGAHIQ